MSREEWHVGHDLWSAYADGMLDAPAEASVEAHVTGCARCRDVAREAAADDSVDRIWVAVRQTISAPVIAWPVRWLRRLGVPDRDLVVLGAADAVVVPWITAIGSALACAVVSGLSGLGDTAFFALAPLVPVLAVMTAFDTTESLRDVSLVTPFPKLRLALLRTTAALAVALPVMTAVSLLVPPIRGLAFWWLLPGLGLTSGALVLLTWLPAWPVAGALSVLWVLGVSVARWLHHLSTLTTPLAQTLCALATVLLVVTFAARTTGLRSTQEGVRP